MTDASNDPLLRRAIDELRRLPVVDPEAVRRVVGAAAAARVSPADEPAMLETGANARRVRLWSAIGLAAAAAVIGFMARGTRMLDRTARLTPTALSAPVNSQATASLRATAAGDRSTNALPQQFVFENGRAQRISVVGDFNKWDPTSAPMARSGEGGLWSAMIPIVPGRHVYGFMIDDSLFVLDPRAPRARDPDLGTEGSVMMVGRP